MTDSQLDEIRERIENFRYFPLEGRRGRGDRFLQPWLFCHVYASGSKRKGEMKRALKEIKHFFNQRELQEIRQDAGADADRLIEEQIVDSATAYLTICRDDDGFGKKLFGLLRMKPEEKEDKILHDVYSGMIPLLIRLEEFPERKAMMCAIDLACRSLYPRRIHDIKALVDSIEDQALRAVFFPFDLSSEESDE